MNYIIPPNQVGRYIGKEIPFAKIDIGRKPGFGRTLSETDVQAVETDRCWQLLGQIKEPDAIDYQLVYVLE